MRGCGAEGNQRVMTGLVPAIGVDARHEAGHDDLEMCKAHDLQPGDFPRACDCG
jgi:hypothetical protein